jgi:hypothetical protein
MEVKIMEHQFEARMYKIYRLMKDTGYVSPRFLEKLRCDGGVRTAASFVFEGTSTGFLRLLRHRQLDYTVEALVLEFPELFPQSVINTARRRVALARDLLAA